MSRDADGNGAGGPRPRRSTGRRIAAWASAVIVVLLVAGVVGGYLRYRAVWDSISRVTVSDLGHRPPKFTSALNLLVFGSGSVAGLTRHQEFAWHVGREQGDAVAETIMIVHISPGRHAATVVNVPRDTVVPVYACPRGSGAGVRWPGQQPSPGAVEQIGDSLSFGGPSCLWKTVEQQTGIRIDHFIELSYLGLVRLVNDVGGVNVCLPFTVHNPSSGLRLTAGRHHIGGVTFLEFWRTRENIGTGSDLQRIQRDDFLLAQLFKGITGSGLLSNPIKLVQVVTSTAPTITTDSGLTQSGMLQTAQSLRSIPGQAVQLVTAPNTPYPANPNWVEFHQPRARRLFRAIAHDRQLPKAVKHAGTGGRPAAAPAPPSRVRVDVLNGSGIAGIAGTAATALTSRGFHVTGIGDAASFGYTTSVIEYGSAAELPAVATLKRQIPSATARRNRGLAPGTLDLILGSSFTTLAAQPSPAPAHATPSPSVSGLASADGGITGGASCRSDAGAFSGPLSP